MAKYGITWWGQQWLNSLTKIDFSNRLPRGRSYAGNGSVRAIEINENKILAKVKGSRPKPYEIAITIPIFSEKQKTTLIDLIGNNPQLLSKLLNKELSPELDSLAREKGIDIFPASWKDFGMNCSCPDWAVPCKHLAAVLYVVANEIHKNPFIILKLHGMDLLKAFENDNTVNTLNSIPEVSTLISPQTVSENKPFDVEALLNIDLSKLSANPPDVLQLLVPTPVFFQKDFKDLLQKATNAVAKNIKSLESDSTEKTDIFDPDSSIKIVFSEDLMSVLAEISTSEKTIQVSPALLVNILKSIEYKQLTSIDFSWVYLHKAYMYCLQLLCNKLYYPKIWVADSDNFLLRFLPAIFSEDVGIVFSQMLHHFPNGIVEVQKNDKKKTKHTIASTDQQLLHLCGIFISHIITETFNSNKFPSVWYEKQEHKNVIDLFTYGNAGGFNTFQTLQIPSSI